ncbi:MAG: hypothetical protein KatS3mg121_0179 [Gammaproteobacteria bacterium]|nr:MAG: hypothetical protein KatS3mg121_0179 [Gammaproteobacteria bacterium]
MGGRLTRRLGERLRRWQFRRLPPPAAEARPSPRSSYVLPTGYGLLFAAVLYVMLLAALNYALNLGLLWVFWLTGVGLLGVLDGYRNLLRVRLSAAPGRPVFAGETGYFLVAVENDSDRPARALRLHAPDGSVLCFDVPARGRRELRVPVPTARRGPLPLPPLRLDTRAPLYIVRCWTWLALDARLLVYPRPAGSRRLPQPAGGTGASRPRLDGDADFDGLRRYRPGDPPSRIYWPAVARSGEKQVKVFRGDGEGVLWLDAALAPQADWEQRLSQLCRWVLAAQRAGLRWGLRLPGVTVPPAAGAAHRHRCLTVLACHGLD